MLPIPVMRSHLSVVVVIFLTVHIYIYLLWALEWGFVLPFPKKINWAEKKSNRKTATQNKVNNLQFSSDKIVGYFVVASYVHNVKSINWTKSNANK